MAKDKAEEAVVAAPEPVLFTTVRSSLKKSADGGDPVALWEADPRHPDGEAYVAGDKPVKVALTPAVKRLIGTGQLVEVK